MSRISTQVVVDAVDMLQMSDVGLYELAWAARTARPDADADAILSAASEALSELRARGAKLVWLRWGSFDVQGHFSDHELPPDAFDEPPERGCYLAIEQGSVGHVADREDGS